MSQKLLLDHNVDYRIRTHLAGFEVSSAADNGWEELTNGRLLRAAADAGFLALITCDKKIEYEQNLKALPLPLIVIDAKMNDLPTLLPFVPHLLRYLSSPLRSNLHVLDSAGTLSVVNTPRPKR